jgi:activator of 2-hydroxyglutaryl-CoA dehydratase
MVRAVGLEPPLLLSGGVARNSAIRELLGREAGTPVRLPSRPQLMGAYGAALVASRGLGPDRAREHRLPAPADAGGPGCATC